MTFSNRFLCIILTFSNLFLGDFLTFSNFLMEQADSKPLKIQTKDYLCNEKAKPDEFHH